MRLVLAILALAACTDSDLDRLESIREQHRRGCAASTDGGIPDSMAEQALSCMNDALASGELAEVSWVDQDSYGFYVTTYVFTVDHQVKAFEYHPHASDYGDPYAIERPTCSGPFSLYSAGFGRSKLSWDGCP